MHASEAKPAYLFDSIELLSWVYAMYTGEVAQNECLSFPSTLTSHVAEHFRISQSTGQHEHTLRCFCSRSSAF